MRWKVLLSSVGESWSTIIRCLLTAPVQQSTKDVGILCCTVINDYTPMILKHTPLFIHQSIVCLLHNERPLLHIVKHCRHFWHVVKLNASCINIKIIYRLIITRIVEVRKLHAFIQRLKALSNSKIITIIIISTYMDGTQWEPDLSNFSVSHAENWEG